MYSTTRHRPTSQPELSKGNTGMALTTLLSCNVNRVGGGPRVVVSTAAFHARVRVSVPSLGGLKETKLFLPHPRVKVSIVGSLRDREVACSASDRQGSNFESCVWRTVSSQSSHHPQEVLLAQFSLYVHKGGLKPDSFHLSIELATKCFLLEHLSLATLVKCKCSDLTSNRSEDMNVFYTSRWCHRLVLDQNIFPPCCKLLTCSNSNNSFRMQLNYLSWAVCYISWIYNGNSYY